MSTNAPPAVPASAIKEFYLEDPPHPRSKSAHFLSLSINIFRCFNRPQKLDLSNKKGDPSLFTIILGDNGTGKSTLLFSLAGIAPAIREPLVLELKDGKKWGNYATVPAIISKFDLYSRMSLFMEGSYIDSEYVITNSDKIDFLKYDMINNNISYSGSDELIHMRIFGYGASRTYGSWALNEETESGALDSLLDESAPLINPETWLLQTDYSAKQEGTVGFPIICPTRS